jgi:hypothetical protein
VKEKLYSRDKIIIMIKTPENEEIWFYTKIKRK